MKRKVDVYQMVTDQIVKSLEEGTVPWQKPWKTATINTGRPTNFLTKNAYRGINTFLLGMLPTTSNLFGTWKQITSKGGSVLPEYRDQGAMVVFWKIVDVKDRENPGEFKKIPFLRYYRVYSLDHTEGLDKYIEKCNPKVDTIEFNPVEEAEALWNNYYQHPALVIGGDKAAYSPAEDKIMLPKPEDFNTPECYYGALFHESVHSTGHKSRLDRLDKDSYAGEELVAEMGASFLLNMCGISTKETMENSAAYIDTWMKRIKDDKKLVIRAGAKAQKATDHILTGEPKAQEAEVA